MTELSDLQALAGLHTRFTDISGMPIDKEVRQTASECADTLEKIILNEHPDIKEGMRNVSDALAGMKRKITTGEAGRNRFPGKPKCSYPEESSTRNFFTSKCR